MADAPPTTLDDLEVLRPRLVVPEPMCVALAAVLPRSTGPAGAEAGPADLAPAVERRLRAVLRGYDELVGLPGGRFAIVLPTLADVAGLRRRIDQLHDLLAAPYELDRDDRERPSELLAVDSVDCALGAAIRRPAERPAELLGRVLDAFEEARLDDRRGPVLV